MKVYWMVPKSGQLHLMLAGGHAMQACAVKRKFSCT